MFKIKKCFCFTELKQSHFCVSCLDLHKLLRWINVLLKIIELFLNAFSLTWIIWNLIFSESIVLKDQRFFNTFICSYLLRAYFLNIRFHYIQWTHTSDGKLNLFSVSIWYVQRKRFKAVQRARNEVDSRKSIEWISRQHWMSIDRLS